MMQLGLGSAFARAEWCFAVALPVAATTTPATPPPPPFARLALA
jgi:hypothetical protein